MKTLTQLSHRVPRLVRVHFNLSRFGQAHLNRHSGIPETMLWIVQQSGTSSSALMHFLDCQLHRES